MRVRAFTQDDAHIFCTEDQITAESVAFCELLLSVYRDFGFKDVRVKFSDRPTTRAGADAVWDKAEAALKHAVEAAGLPYTMNPGEGAFYGPKLEFVLRDALGRDWQCGTLQVDFVMPERLVKTVVAGSMIVMLGFIASSPRFGAAPVAPSRLRLAVGFAAVTVLGVYGVIYWIVNANFPGPLFGGAGIVLVLGIQGFVLALIGESLGRIQRDVEGRPLYTIEEEL